MPSTSTLDIALDHIFAVEGGYVDDPNDPGGRTIYGISERAHPDVWRDGPPTREQAKQIYIDLYWNRLDLGKLDNHFAILAFDASIQHGVPTVRRWLDTHTTFESFLAHRIDYYTRISTWGSFGRGWMRRISHLLTLLDSLPRTVDIVVDNRPLWKRVLGAFHGETRNVAYRVRLLTRWAGTKMDLEDSRVSH